MKQTNNITKYVNKDIINFNNIINDIDKLINFDDFDNFYNEWHFLNNDKILKTLFAICKAVKSDEFIIKYKTDAILYITLKYDYLHFDVVENKITIIISTVDDEIKIFQSV